MSHSINTYNDYAKFSENAITIIFKTNGYIKFEKTNAHDEIDLNLNSS